MNKIFIIIGISLAMLLSSCSTYKAELYPCDFNKYKIFRTDCRNTNIGTGYIESSVNHGLCFSGFIWDTSTSNRDDTLILTVDTSNGIIFPPHLGRHWIFAWDWPPKTATIIATDSVTGEKLFAIYYSRYTVSMDGDGYHDRIQSAVEYCVRELKKNPPKDGPFKTTIPASSLSEVTKRIYSGNSSVSIKDSNVESREKSPDNK